MFQSTIWCIYVLSQTPVKTPQTLQNWFFPWNNSKTIKSILTSEYRFVIYIKNAIKNYIQIWAYDSNLCQTPKFETPIFLFLCIHTCGLLMDYCTRFFPPIINRVDEDLLLSPDYMTFLYSYQVYHQCIDTYPMIEKFKSSLNSV